jgi:serine/threonine protein kinase
MKALADERLTDRFEVKEQIGEGGFAIVFRAIDRRTGTAVALKVLKDDYLHDPEVLGRFQREVYAVASVTNPHIVALHDFGIQGELVYLATEFVDGKTLREAMAQPLPAREIYSIVSQIAEALGAAHARNIVHRDLKPENVLLASGRDGAPVVKVVDFGVAKLAEVERELGLQPVSLAGVSFGTPQYMSPEQIRGEPASPAVDLFALGVMTYEMVAGAPPWRSREPQDTFAKVMKEPPPRIPRSRQALRRRLRLNRFFRCVLAKQKAERPGDEKAFLRLLETALFGRGPGHRDDESARFWPWAIAATALALAALALWAVVRS